MRIVFFSYRGTIGARCLQWLLGRDDAQVLAVVTWPDYVHPEMRIAVKEVLYDANLPLYQPRDANSPAFVDLMRTLEPDVFVSMYFGKLFKAPLLAVPKHGCVNIHNSLLPRYRGQAPSIWAVANGDTVTGQTMHYLDEGMDTGDIIAQKSCPVTPEDTGHTVGAKLEDLGVELFQEAFPLVLAGKASRLPQDDSAATRCRSPRPSDMRIDWTKPAASVYDFVRAFTTPLAGAYTRLGGTTMRVWDAEPLTDGGRWPSSALAGEVVGIAPAGPVVRCGDGFVVLHRFTLEGLDEAASRLSFMNSRIVSFCQ
ncbi:MAG: methionyl-tRNA formyltransferase [Anaerolineae bacterium]